MGNVLITLYGRSTWGLFNSAWAAIIDHGFMPDRIHVLTAGCDSNQAKVAEAMLRSLLESYGRRDDVQEHIVDDEDVRAVADLVTKIAKDEKSRGNSVALDVTPGKKALVLGSVFSGFNQQLFDKVFYLHIASLKNANRPYVEIPLFLQHPHDIVKELSERPKEAKQ
ncbi:MAG: hypothetical protein ABR879_06740 [Methanomassiliicoccales archaeon]